MRPELRFRFMSRLGRSVCVLFRCFAFFLFGGVVGLVELANVLFADAFIRDELSKGRYDAALSGICFEMLRELFNRTLRSDLGPRNGEEIEIEDVC